MHTERESHLEENYLREGIAPQAPPGATTSRTPNYPKDQNRWIAIYASNEVKCLRLHPAYGVERVSFKPSSSKIRQVFVAHAPHLGHLGCICVRLCAAHHTSRFKSATLVPIHGSWRFKTSRWLVLAAVAAVAASVAAVAAVAAVAVLCLCACLCACVRCVPPTLIVGGLPRFWESGRGLHCSRIFRTSRYR